jgi:hypothetical protein
MSLAEGVAPIPGTSPDLKGLGEEVKDERRKTGDVPGSQFSVPDSQFPVLSSGSWFRFSVLSPQFLRGATRASPPSSMMNTVSFEGRVIIKPR